MVHIDKISAYEYENNTTPTKLIIYLGGGSYINVYNGDAAELYNILSNPKEVL